MKKSFFSSIAAFLVICLFGASFVYAASVKADLRPSVSRAQSKPLPASGKLNINITKNDDFKVQFSVWKKNPGNDQYIAGATTQNSTSLVKNVGTGEYYLLLVCKSPTGKGCEARGSLYN